MSEMEKKEVIPFRKSGRVLFTQLTNNFVIQTVQDFGL